MNTFLDLVYSLIVTPRAALYDITRGERLREAGILWLFTLFLTALSAFSEGPGLLVEFLAVLLFLGLSLLVHSAVTDYLSGLLGGQGSAKGITAGFMAASLPLAFSVFFTLAESIGLSFLSGIGSFAICVWTFVLDVLAIRENYFFSTGKSVLIAIAPYVMILLFLLLFSKRHDNRLIANISLFPSLMNINETVIFGMPIVFNPLLDIPFILAPLVTLTVGYFLISTGFCPRIVIEVPWVMPPILLGFLVTGGSIYGALSHLIAICVSLLVYAPFIYIYERKQKKEEYLY